MNAWIDFNGHSFVKLVLAPNSKVGNPKISRKTRNALGQNEVPKSLKEVYLRLRATVKRYVRALFSQFTKACIVNN